MSMAGTTSELSIAMRIEKDHLELHLLVAALREEQVLAHARSQPEKARCKPTTPRWKRSAPRLALGVADASDSGALAPAARLTRARVAVAEGRGQHLYEGRNMQPSGTWYSTFGRGSREQAGAALGGTCNL